MQILSASSLTAEVELLAITSSGALGALPAALPQPLTEALREAAESEEFKGRSGSLVALRTLGHIPARWLVLVGAGEQTPPELRIAAGVAASFARDRGLTSMTLTLGVPSAAAAEAAIEGAAAGNYRFDRNKDGAARKSPLAVLNLFGADLSESSALRARARADAQRLARDLVNEPAEVIYPETLAEAALHLAGPQMAVEIWDEVRIREAGMGGLSAVGRASDRPPRFVHMRWTPPTAPKAKVALVGKGVTYDSGGLSLKPSDGQLTMRCDMGGAAAVIGVMSALETLKPAVEVHGIFAAAENMISGRAYKLGDVLRHYNGKTVEIHNTDAEGRLLLADCLAYASKLGVDTCLDMATLTGAAVVALGERYTAFYTRSDGLSARLQASSVAAGERIWRMPLDDAYKSMLKSDWATLKNVGGREAGSITAALFLSEFVENMEWAHLDIAGPAFLSAPIDHLGKGGTGHPVPTLLHWLESF